MSEFIIKNGVLERYTGAGGHVTIPSGVTEIGWNAFRFQGTIAACTITSCTIPAGVVRLDNWAFLGCRSLTAVTLPETLTEIGQSAFLGCSALTSITIPAATTHIDTGILEHCSSLAEIRVAAGNPRYHSAGNCLIETATGKLLAGCSGSVIPADGSVTEIKGGAFKGSNFSAIVIPEGVTYIGNDAFENCKNLSLLYLPDSLTALAKNAIRGCMDVRFVAHAKQCRAGGVLQKKGTRAALGYLTAYQTFPYTAEDHTFFVDYIKKHKRAILPLVLERADLLRGYLRCGLLALEELDAALTAAERFADVELNAMLLAQSKTLRAVPNDIV